MDQWDHSDQLARLGRSGQTLLGLLLRVILLNLGREPYQVHAGDRVAQMVIARYERIEWEEAELADSRRGEGGFGSSGR